MNRWSKSGALDRKFEKLQLEQIVRIRIRGFLSGLDLSESASARHRGVKKTDHRPSASRATDGPPRFIWLPRMLERP